MAAKTGYPLVFLRMMCRIYLLPRVLIMDAGISSYQIFPCRGVLAGSASACYELFMVLGITLNALLQSEGSRLPDAIVLDCTAPVDDISLVIMGRDKPAMLAVLEDMTVKLAHTMICLLYTSDAADE